MFAALFSRLGKGASQCVRTLSASASVGSDSNPRIGLVGMGGVGQAIARNLRAAGKDVVAFCDTNPDVACEGVARATTPREVAEVSSNPTPCIVSSY